MNVKECLEALQPLARQGKAALKLEEALSKLVSIENHGDELEKRLVNLKNQVLDAEDHVAMAEAKAVKVCADAKAKAEQVVADAERDAKALAEITREECRKQVRSAEDAKAVQQAAEAEYAEKADALRAEVANLQARRDALAAELGSLRDRASAILA